MTTQQLGQRLYAATDAQAWEAVRAMSSPQVVVQIGSGNPVPLDTWLTNLKGIYDGFPDAHHVVQHRIVSGDWFVSRLRFEGTHMGPFRGVEPTGRQMSTGVVHVDRFEAGFLVEHYGQIDMLGLLRQIGALQ